MMRRGFRDPWGGRFCSSPVERMHDKALVGGVLERARRLLAIRRGGKVGLRMGQRVQLRGAARKGKRKRKKQSVKDPPAHARIIHAPREDLDAAELAHFAPARHWSSPAMKRSFGSFLPMNTMTDSFFSPLTHGLPTSPPIIMWTPWNTTRFGLPFIHSTPL